jgi:predicted HTH transcriptional regulator
VHSRRPARRRASKSTPSYANAEDLVKNPRETLARELKEWLDPTNDEDRATLVKAILAMRNHEFGGAIAIGISKEGNRKPPPTFDVKSAYEQEKIQEIVSKHASRKFEVEIQFVEFDGVRYPVIVVPGVADMPVVCKSTIGQGPKPLLREGVIYVRTLDSSNVPSTAPARELRGVFFQIFASCRPV